MLNKIDKAIKAEREAAFQLRQAEQAYAQARAPGAGWASVMQHTAIRLERAERNMRRAVAHRVACQGCSTPKENERHLTNNWQEALALAASIRQEITEAEIRLKEANALVEEAKNRILENTVKWAARLEAVDQSKKAAVALMVRKPKCLTVHDYDWLE